jgi:hypothetical protein
MFGFKKRRAKRKAQEEALARQQLRDAIVAMIGLAEGGAGAQVNTRLILHSGERLVDAMTGVGLFEPRREAGHCRGS